MTAPAPGPADAGVVAATYAGGGDDATVERVTGTVEAVNAIVRRFTPVPAEGAPWPADVVLGANMLAGRLWRRRNSPAGVEAFAAEGAVYVQRNDPDVAMLLQLGAYTPPRVG